MAKEKSLKRNYIYNLSYQILAVLTPLITARHLARTLGVDPIGAYSYTASVVALFGLFATLGTLIYGNREISYVQKDKAAYSKVFWNIEFLSIISVVVVAVFYGIFIAFQTNYLKLYLIQSITLVSVAGNISWFFQGLEEVGKVALRNAIFRILNVLFTVIFIQKPEDLFLYVAGVVILELLGHLSVWVYLPKYVNRPHIKDFELMKHFKGTLLLFIPAIAISIYTILDKTMIGWFTTTTTENGYYEQAMKLAKAALTLVTALEAVMIPRVSAMFEQKDEEGIKKLLYGAYRFVWFLSLPLAFGLFSVANHFIPWFYGEGMEPIARLLKILAFLIPAIGLSNVTGVQYLMATKRENKVTITIFIGAAVNLCMNLILIPRLFSMGAAIASVTAEFVISFVQLFLIRKEFHVGKILLSGVKSLIAAVAMTVALYFLGRLLAYGLGSTLILIVSGMAIYFVCLILLHEKLLWDTFAKIKNRLIK